MPSRSTVLRPAATADSSSAQTPSSAGSAQRAQHDSIPVSCCLLRCSLQKQPRCKTCVMHTASGVTQQTASGLTQQTASGLTQQVDVVNIQHAAVALRQQARLEHRAPLLAQNKKHTRHATYATWC